MKRTRYIALAALALLTVMGFGSKANAQVSGSKAVPAAVQRQWLADERLYIEVFVDNKDRPGNDPEGVRRPSSNSGEHYGNRLGDVIPMRVRIFCVLPNGEKVPVPTKPNGNTPLRKVEVNFAALQNGQLTNEADPDNNPDWVLAKKEVLAPGEKSVSLPSSPTVVKIVTPDGTERDAELWDIKLFVQTPRQPDPMLFWMEFTYCTELNANGQHEWMRGETPDYIISGSYTGDKGRDLELGNTNEVAQQNPVNLALLALGLGGTMLLLPVGLMITRAVQRAMAKPHSDAVTPALVWAVFDPILEKTRTATGDGYDLTQQHVAVIVKTFKQYIGFHSGVAAFKAKIGEYDNGEQIYRLLENLEYRVLERGEDLSAQRYLKLITVIEQLCPRP